MNILISGANIGTDLCDEVYPGCRDTVYQAGAKAFAAEVLGYQSLSGHATRSGKVEYLANSLMNLSEVVGLLLSINRRMTIFTMSRILMG